jgi:hypothetical protein
VTAIGMNSGDQDSTIRTIMIGKSIEFLTFSAERNRRTLVSG